MFEDNTIQTYATFSAISDFQISVYECVCATTALKHVERRNKLSMTFTSLNMLKYTSKLASRTGTMRNATKMQEQQNPRTEKVTIKR